MILSESFLIARLTPNGRGAVGTVHLKGSGAMGAIRSSFRTRCSTDPDFPTDRPVFGHFFFEQDLYEEVVLHKMDDQNWELHLHGGDRISRRIMDHLILQGGREVYWRDLEGSPQTVEEEVRDLLPFAPTTRTAGHLLRQVKNGLQKTLDSLADLPSEKLEELMILSNTGIHLIKPYSILLIGPANVGKSSLINRLLGFDRVMVDPAAGTTRDTIAADTVLDGWPIRIMDTAGIRSTDDPIEKEGIFRIRKFLEETDLVLFILDPTVEGKDPFRICRETLLDGSERSDPDLFDRKRKLTILNKIDLPFDIWNEDRKANTEKRDHLLSLQSGEGWDTLKDALLGELLPPLYLNKTEYERAQLQIPFTERQIALIQDAVQPAFTASRF